MQGLEQIIRSNKEAQKLATAPRNLHNGEVAKLVGAVSGKNRKRFDKSVATESSETV